MCSSELLRRFWKPVLLNLLLLHRTLDLFSAFLFQVFPKDHIESALKTVFQMNVMRFQGGFMGAVNGMRPCGRVCKLYQIKNFL